MARKRANVNKQKSQVAKPLELSQFPPIQEMESMYFKELINSSNTYAALLKQEAQYNFAVKKLEESRNKIQNGDITLPIIITLIPKVMSYEEVDKKKVLKLMDEHIKEYKQSLVGIRGQLEHRKDEFIECGNRTKQFMNSRFATAVTKNIVPDRKTSRKEEENLFEAEFSKLVEQSEEGEKLRKEYKAAKKEAVKRNTKKVATKKE